jgi:hypothetical protein
MTSKKKEKEKEIRCCKCEKTMHACDCRGERIGFRAAGREFYSENGSDMEEDDV